MHYPRWNFLQKQLTAKSINYFLKKMNHRHWHRPKYTSVIQFDSIVQILQKQVFYCMKIKNNNSTGKSYAESSAEV